MKKLYLLLALILAAGSTKAQTCVGTGPSSVTTGRSTSEAVATTPVVCNSQFVVRVNIHFILKSNGTGNFTEVSDGGSLNNVSGYTGVEQVEPSSYWNGYRVAETLVSMANLRNTTNYQMALPPGNSTPYPPKKLIYVLNGTYFHRSDDLYQYDEVDYGANTPGGIFNRGQFNTYGVNKSSEINIFMMGQSTRILSPNTPNYGTRYAHLTGGASGLGFANAASQSTDGSTGIWTKMGNLWRLHILARRDGGTGSDANGPWPWPMDQAGKMINHELGHLFGLIHANESDGCADTPAYTLGYAPGPGENNTMVSGADQLVLTPCQIDKIQTALGSDYQPYVTCSPCLPPHAFLVVPTAGMYNCGSTVNLVVDGRGSFNETNYNYTLTEVDANRQPIGVGLYTSASTPVDQFTLAGLVAGKRYRLILNVYNSCGSHSVTQYINLACSGTPGGGMRAMAVYPNPATAAGFTVQYEQEPRQLPVIRDNVGQPVRVERTAARYEAGQWHVSYRLPTAPAGLYLLETGEGADRNVRQLSIQRL
jgi:hypothetical protein